MDMVAKFFIIVIISANAEWNVVKQQYPNELYQKSPYGEYFVKGININPNEKKQVIFFHGGWGKISAAGSAQYVIDTWKPAYIVNLGTCGGYEGKINRFDVILVDKTIVYDIIEQMGDSQQAIKDYSTDIDLSWLPEKYPTEVKKFHLVSADRDLLTSEVQTLQEKYNAIAGDWETGAIAWVANKNKVKTLILRGVSDLVSEKSGEAYNNEKVFVSGTETVMKKLLEALPLWLANCK